MHELCTKQPENDGDLYSVGQRRLKFVSCRAHLDNVPKEMLLQKFQDFAFVHRWIEHLQSNNQWGVGEGGAYVCLKYSGMASCVGGMYPQCSFIWHANVPCQSELSLLGKYFERDYWQRSETVRTVLQSTRKGWSRVS